MRCICGPTAGPTPCGVLTGTIIKELLFYVSMSNHTCFILHNNPAHLFFTFVEWKWALTNKYAWHDAVWMNSTEGSAMCFTKTAVICRQPDRNVLKETETAQKRKTDSTSFGQCTEGNQKQSVCTQNLKSIRADHNWPRLLVWKLLVADWQVSKDTSMLLVNYYKCLDDVLNQSSVEFLWSG